MSMPPRRLAFGVAAAMMVVAGSVVLGLMGSPTNAGSAGGGPVAMTDNTFLIPHADGYGVAECIAGSGECGRIVANAWCESKGFKTAAAYGVTQASDITGSVSSRGQRAAEPPLYITCKK
jgi:hypothetical protein